MKLWYLLILTLVFVITCKKDDINNDIDNDIDNDFTVRGVVRDATTNKALSGIRLRAYSWVGDANDAWNGTLTIQIYADDITDNDGQFEISFSKSSWTKNSTSVSLGSDNLPAGYQHYATSNGGRVNLFLDPNDYYSTPLVEQMVIKDDQQYSVLLLPKTYYTFAIPTLTPELKHDTLLIETPMLYHTLKESYYLGLQSNLTEIRKVRELVATNWVTGNYQLRRNTVIKSGSFSVQCAPRDTTIVFLDF
jgi:hypothetical protein